MATSQLSPKILERIQGHGLILYDGECGFCQFWVQFILKRDPVGYFLFARLQDLGLHLDTVRLYEREVHYEKLDAIFQIAKHLNWPWRFARIFKAMPKFLRDSIYDFVAKRRHRVNLKQFCALPTADERKRFIRLG